MMKDIVERHRKVVFFVGQKHHQTFLHQIKTRQQGGMGAKTLYLTKGSDKDKTKKKSEVFLVL